MSAKKGPFRRCSACSGKLPFQDHHSLCLFCLGETHSPTTCKHCREFTKATLKSRQQRLKYFLWNRTLSASQPSDMESVQSVSTVRSSVTLVSSSPPSTSKEVSTKVSKAKSKKLPTGKKSSSDVPSSSTSAPTKKKGPSKAASKAKAKTKEITLVVPPVSASVPSPFLEDSSRDRDSVSDLGAPIPPRQPPPVDLGKSPTVSQLDKLVAGAESMPLSPILTGRTTRSPSLLSESGRSASSPPPRGRPTKPVEDPVPRRPASHSADDEPLPKKPRHRRRHRRGHRRRRDSSPSDSEYSRGRKRSHRRRRRRDSSTESSSTSRDRRHRRKRSKYSYSSSSRSRSPRRTPSPNRPSETGSGKPTAPTDAPTAPPVAPPRRPAEECPPAPKKTPSGPKVPRPPSSPYHSEEEHPGEESSGAEDDTESEVSLEVPIPGEPLPPEAANLKPSSPSEDFSSYTQMVGRMAQALKLAIEQSPRREENLIFGDIEAERTHPVSLSFIPELMDLIKEFWDHPANATSISKRTENLYRIHGDNTSFLVMHPAPNSLIVESSSTKTPAKGHPTPTNKEGRKLEILARRMYSMTTFTLRAVNYLVAMGAYQKQLWSRVLPALQMAPDDIRQLCLDTHAEALTVSKYQRLAARHVAEATSKNFASLITLRRHAWLRSANIVEDIKTRVENLPFDATGLFSQNTDENLENLHKSKKTAKSYSVQPPPRQSKPQWRPKYTTQSYQQPSTSTYRPYGGNSSQRPPQASSSSSAAFRPQPSRKRQSFKAPGRKQKQYL
ncbi:uncharacterized protein LOC144583550 [Pogona vitticeps]